MRDALHAEWTKLRTLASTYWLLLAGAVLTVGVSSAVVATTSYQAAGFQDTPRLALSGIDLGQAVVAVLAVLAISNEYSTGMVCTTLTAMPRRLVMLGAKAATLACFVAVAGVVAVGGSLLAGRAILPGNGFTVAHGYHPLSLGHGPTLRAAVGSVLYFVLVALLSVGVATAVRESATAIGTVLGLLYLLPLLAQVVSDPAWHRHLEQMAPMTAGLSIQATTKLQSLPISPWAGLGVLAAWSAGALFIGGFLLNVRDA
ncbi:MAG: ABC transporter permease [Acidimicrobiales bacterium]|jgi:ABC-2 type transport system permease protein